MKPLPLVAVVSVVAVAAAAFLPALDNGFTQDDSDLVERGSVVARGDVREIFTSDYWAGTGLPDRSLYRPVTVLTFALERRCTGGVPDPRAGHAVNLALHAAVSALLLAYLLRLGAGLPAAFAASLLFAAHPLHVAAVANLVGRAEILTALFVLGSLLCMSAAWDWPGATPPLERGPLAPRLAAWGAAACLFLALGSKEVALAAPALVVAQELIFRPPRAGRSRAWLLDRASALAPSLLAAVVYLGLRTRAILDFPGVQQVRPMDNPILGQHGAARLATSLAMAARYLGLLLFPSVLRPDYSGRSIPRETTLLAPLALVGGLAIGVAAVVTVFPLLARHVAPLRVGRWVAPARTRVAAMSACVLLLTYLLVGNLVLPVGAGFAERLMYLPSAGFCMLAGLAASACAGTARRARAAAVAAVLAGLALAGVSHARAESRRWKDDETLFVSAAADCQRSVRVRYVNGEIDERAGRPEAALHEFEAVIALWPEHFAAWIEKGRLLGERGDLAGAEAALRESIRIHPMVGEAHMLLGITLSRLERLTEAEHELRKALLLDPTLLKAAVQLGHVLYRTGRYDEAAAIYRRCVRAGRSDLARALADAEARSAARREAQP